MIEQSKSRKYSYLNEIYSRDHWAFRDLDNRYKRLYLTDLDRLWVERGNDMIPLAMIDLKWPNELYEHNSKNFDHALITGYVKFCFYIICHVDPTNEKIIKYIVIDYLTREQLQFDGRTYPEFLLHFRDHEYCIEYRKKQKEKFSKMEYDELANFYPNASSIFFKKDIDNHNAERTEGESFHDYSIRKNITCYCLKCI